MHNMPLQERERLGKRGRKHVEDNYNFEDFNRRWVELVDKIIDERGSHQERAMYESWQFKEIA